MPFSLSNPQGPRISQSLGGSKNSKSSGAVLRCDFHCHSYHSDGAQSPTAVAQAMKANGVEVFALTDHDTFAGVSEAQQAAGELGIHCLAGIELTIQWDNGTFHLLGLGLKELAALQEPLAELQRRRLERNQEIVKKLRKLGVAVDAEELQTYCDKAGEEILNRSHIAAYLVEKGACQSYHEAFQRYLAVGAAAYVAIDGPSPEEGIEWIHAAGGYTFIAHPHTLHLNWKRFKSYVGLWREAGLNGLEVSHPRTVLKDAKRLLKMCQLYGLQFCGGSDYHRGETENVLGRGSAGRPIDLPLELAYLQAIAV